MGGEQRCIKRINMKYFKIGSISIYDFIILNFENLKIPFLIYKKSSKVPTKSDKLLLRDYRKLMR